MSYDLVAKIKAQSSIRHFVVEQHLVIELQKPIRRMSPWYLLETDCMLSLSSEQGTLMNRGAILFGQEVLHLGVYVLSVFVPVFDPCLATVGLAADELLRGKVHHLDLRK